VTDKERACSAGAGRRCLEQPGVIGEQPDGWTRDALGLAHKAIDKFPEIRKRYSRIAAGSYPSTAQCFWQGSDNASPASRRIGGRDPGGADARRDRERRPAGQGRGRRGRGAVKPQVTLKT